MIKVIGNDFWRGGQKVGFLSGDHIIDHEGTKIGNIMGDHIYDKHGNKVAFIEGDYIYIINPSRKIRIEDNNQEVFGGTLTSIQKAAARVLFGE